MAPGCDFQTRIPQPLFPPVVVRRVARAGTRASTARRSVTTATRAVDVGGDPELVASLVARLVGIFRRRRLRAPSLRRDRDGHEKDLIHRLVSDGKVVNLAIIESCFEVTGR